jgi:hypothetical protein
MSYRRAAITVIAFAVAMAYLESAVVVYLELAQSVSPDALFPVRSLQGAVNLSAIEVGREFATLVMLVAVGCLVGRRWIDKLGWTAVAFGIWDILYYVWLWVFIGWPHSPTSWDLLFLIPVPWSGPVWAPIAVSGGLVVAGLVIGREVILGRSPQITLVRGGSAAGGGLLVIGSFVANAPVLVSGGTPGWYPWPLLVAGMALACWSVAASVAAGRRAAVVG